MIRTVRAWLPGVGRTAQDGEFLSEGRYQRTERVEFHDTDMSGLIFFGAVTRWTSRANSAILDDLGLLLRGMVAGFAYPTRAASFEYVTALRYGDSYDQRSWISTVGRTSFTISHRFLHGDTLSVTATTTHVAIANGRLRAMTVPSAVRESCWQVD